MLTSLFNGQLPNAVFFDLDGTLVDSLPDLATAVDNMLVELGYKKAGANNVGLWVGNGAEKLVQRALAHAKITPEDKISSTEVDQTLPIFFNHYGLCSGRFSKLYPDVIDTLDVLKNTGVKLCVITNKPKQFTPGVLQDHKLEGYFELVLSGDSLKHKKPSPIQLLFALEKLSVQKNQAVMVGDSSNDILAANAAGIRSICVTYGYNHGGDPRKLPANGHIDGFSQLLS
jgi:phosphoglycolate phosphatase